MVRLTCSLALLACLAPPAGADVPPPPPEKGLKRVPREHVLKLEAALPGHQFFTFEQRGLGAEPTVQEELRLSPGTGTRVPASSSPSMRTGVVAVSDRAMSELKTKENLAKLLTWDKRGALPAGVVIHETRGTTRDLKESDPRDKVENVVTVSGDDKGGVRFTEREEPGPTGPEPAGPAAAPEPAQGTPLATLIAGGAAALAVVALGVWYARRK